MSFPKLTAMAQKMGYSHLSLEFLVEFRDAIPEWEKLAEDGRAMFARPDDETVVDAEPNADALYKREGE